MAAFDEWADGLWHGPASHPARRLRGADVAHRGASVDAVRLLLVSTYELGQQPLGIAGPGAVLAAAGHEVRGRDLALDELLPEDLDWADAIACSVPMHTALRLALAALAPVLRDRPDLPVALHGLYATVGAPALRAGDLAVAGEVGDALLAWAASVPTRLGAANTRDGASEPLVRVDIGRPSRRSAVGASGAPRVAGALPDRTLAPPLERYARLVSDAPDRLVGGIEASRGCSHRCTHCPVPTVYDGRTRAVPLDDVLADVDQVVAAGAGHVHFTDPDFLNRPAHALRVARALHERHPDVSFDATIKVSHLLAHRDAVSELARCGCIFVVSAFESTSSTVLAHLKKGHTAADAAEAVRVLRECGIEPRPSFLPFTPWTTLPDVVELLDFVSAHDLVDSVDPVQYGIRLLLPPGSLLLREPDRVLVDALLAYDTDALGWTWRSADPAVDALQQAVASRTEDAASCDEPAVTTYAAVRALAFAALGIDDPAPPARVAPSGARTRPRLSESWFCCAEPTAAQLGVATASGAR
ncbi:MAG TPA: CUAEP/CCAEP-tail radical SAM protein [Acidimicrobiales bacterium]|nr:CUAEP/CCAEP-tail radical SAM protein [Acidimicrobiales bacterium]